jgi:hypothetical protein
VRENEEEFLLESEEYLCLFLNAFDLGCTTLILKIASLSVEKKKQNSLSSVINKRGRVCLFFCFPH